MLIVCRKTLDRETLKFRDDRVELVKGVVVVLIKALLLGLQRPLIFGQQRSDVEFIGEFQEGFLHEIGDVERGAWHLNWPKQEEEETPRGALVFRQHEQPMQVLSPNIGALVGILVPEMDLVQ